MKCNPKLELLTTGQVVGRVALIVMVAEFAVMMLVESMPIIHGNAVAKALADIVLLALLSTPIIYCWVIRPFVLHRDRSLADVDFLARTDGLTQLANRREFDRVIALEHARHARSGGDLSLIMLDIDQFKAFNDSYGHLSGDDCLRQVAKIIAALVARPHDLAARYGGEEFVCILPDTDRAGAIAIAERIRGEISRLAIPHAGSDIADHVTASLGVASLRCSRESQASSLVAEADRLVYLAKSQGRNRVASDARAADISEARLFLRLIWQPVYVSANDLINRQHQSLFAAANQLLDDIQADFPREHLLAQAEALIEETRQHFHDEIQCLRSAGEAGVEAHAREHERLLERAFNLLQAFGHGLCSPGELFEFLAVEVIAQHILAIDRQAEDRTVKPA